jgi:Ca2+-binding EF-hand superfamily protein
MKRAISIGFAISMAMFSGFAVAAPDAAIPSPVVSLDGDNDQTVDISEMGKAASDSFDKIDSDGDGNVDRAALGKRMSKDEFKKADADKDNVLTKNEYFIYADSLLRIADGDKDGTLDDKEFKSKEGKKLLGLIQ